MCLFYRFSPTRYFSLILYIILYVRTIINYYLGFPAKTISRINHIFFIPAHFVLRQESLIAQPWQPQPQEDFPCLLFLIIERTITAITAASTPHIIIVDKLLKNHVTMKTPPLARLLFIYAPTFTLFFRLPDSLYGLNNI